MDEEVLTGIIIAFVVALLIVAIAAKAKKKKLNATEQSEEDFVSHEESPRIETQQGRSQQVKPPTGSQHNSSDIYAQLLYYVFLDGITYGPFSLEQLKSYPLLEDTLITTNTLNDSWYEAKYFECLDDLFRPNLPFRIDADGTIIRLEQDGETS